MKRRTPVRHRVKSHKRMGKTVQSYSRGSGVRQKRIVQRPRTIYYKISRKKERVYSLVGTKRDSRFTSSVQRKFKTGITDVINYLTGKTRIIGKVSNDKYTVIIIDSVDKSMGRRGRNLAILNSRPNEPVPTGFWMDLPEKEWGYSKARYSSLPEKERAILEAQEQLDKWVDKQFYSNWLDFYAPEIHDRMFWSGEIDMKASYEDRNKQAKKIVKSLWRKK